jgi:sigma-B regulation protein RsbU (phosphoserine phosphatase)
VTEAAFVKPRKAGAADTERIYAEWVGRMPDSLRRAAPPPDAELRHLLHCALRVLEDPSLTALDRLDGAACSIARSMIENATLELLLRFIRDELTRLLFRYVPAERRVPTSLTQLASRLGDAIWSTHTDLLQQTISRQRDERFEQELMLAKSIQQRLLPRRIPTIPGFDVAGRVLAAREVGGDYWSVKDYPDDGVVTFKLADVTGHGIAAATLVAAVKFISGGFYRGAASAAQVMERTNHVLVKETPSEIMIPMVYGWLYPAAKAAIVVNAGHEPFFICRADGRIEELPPTGLVLGLMETRYQERQVHFEPGDLLFACSDGITAAAAGASLGIERVKALVVANANQPAAVLVQRMLEAALGFYGTPKDDMSLIVLKRSE